MAVQGGALSGPGELEARMRELGMIPLSREEREAQLQEAFGPICRVCDGGPGNHGVCLCGEKRYGA